MKRRVKKQSRVLPVVVTEVTGCVEVVDTNAVVVVAVSEVARQNKKLKH